MAVLAVGLVLGGIHVAAERRKSPIARLSRPMKLASIVPAIAGLFMVLTWYELPPELHWETSESAALAKANEEHKPVLIDFGASWCGACKELDEKTFPDPKVQKEGARFVALHIDASDDDDPAVAKLRREVQGDRGAARWSSSSTATATRPSASPSSSRRTASPARCRRSSNQATQSGPYGVNQPPTVNASP